MEDIHNKYVHCSRLMLMKQSTVLAIENALGAHKLGRFVASERPGIFRHARQRQADVRSFDSFIILVQQHRINHKCIYMSLFLVRLAVRGTASLVRVIPDRMTLSSGGWFFQTDEAITETDISIEGKHRVNDCHLRVWAPSSFVRYAQLACSDSIPPAVGMPVASVRRLGSSDRA